MPIIVPGYVPESGGTRRTTSKLSSPSTSTRLPTASTLTSRLRTLTAAQRAGLYGLTSRTTSPTTSKLAAPRTSSGSRSGGYSSGSGNRSGYSYSRPTYSRSSAAPRSGGVAAPTKINPVGWNPTGYAKGYLESAADMFAKDPTLMLRDMVTQRYGQAGGETIFGQLAPTIDDANALYLAMQGQDAGQGTNDEWINFLGEFINQQLTPGVFFNSDAALANMFSAVPGSPLQGFLGTGDSLQQGENFSRILNAVLDVGYHPLMAEGIRNNIEQQRQNHAIASAKAAVDPFITYLKAQNPDLTRMIGA